MLSNSSDNCAPRDLSALSIRSLLRDYCEQRLGLCVRRIGRQSYGDGSLAYLDGILDVMIS